MKNYCLFTRGTGMLLVITLLLTACSKSGDPGSGSGNASGGNGGSSGTGNNSTLVYVNSTYTTIQLTANNQTQNVVAGASVSFIGTPGSTLNGTAVTSGLTSSGTQVGLQMAWTLSNSFPASGSFSTNLNTSADYFFLQVINSSGLQMNKLYVNYALQAQTLDNVTIPNDGKTYNIGYYHAYSNSNARAESGTTYWSWPNLNLPGTVNQATVLTAN
jgi:hypothetical protein